MSDEQCDAASNIIVTMCAKMLDSIEGHVKLCGLITVIDERKGKRHRVFLMETVLSILDYALTMNPPENSRALLTKLKHDMHTMRASDLAELAKM